ncbi:lipocalin family protein [Flaviramulus sp. BrNp1-15]|uniref:lipocalin family protein n=1 Tax=Flaviramulus sp. BrNp1-15 TaxID=2916754 RepID=UPI001EE89E9C|nr:lipocalin family protein [Flaviramulus sp. BrNp1-15]ULC57940.1 lipocalin family protein [Flaviramulus sp. BrNp1-15]
MKTIKHLSMLFVILFAFNCSSDDDSNSNNEQQTEDLLTSSKWYQESKTPGSFSDCEKNTSFKFNTDNSIVVESFDDGSGTCQSQGTTTSSYTLNGTTLTITLGSDIITANIDNITSTMLTVTDNSGDTIVFDKTQG